MFLWSPHVYAHNKFDHFFLYSIEKRGEEEKEEEGKFQKG